MNTNNQKITKKTQQFTYEYVKSFNKMNIPDTYLAGQIKFFITTCTPINNMLVDTVRSDLALEAIHGITKNSAGQDNPDPLIKQTQTYKNNKDRLKIILTGKNNILDQMIMQDDLEYNKKIIDELNAYCDEIDKISKEILEEVLNTYLPSDEVE